jgi:hypothetical protein
MRWLSLVLLCAVLVCAPAGTAAAKRIDRGIVVRVLPPRFVIRELDGSKLRFAINKQTVITLDGRPVAMSQLSTMSASG